MLLCCLFLLFLQSQTFGQKDISKRVDEKLKTLKGNISKITIYSDDEELIFENEEAAQLYKRLKPGKKSIKIISEGESEVSKIWTENFCTTGDSTLNLNKKKVKVEIKGDTKKVTITTYKNGGEQTDVLEGEEAEKYLEKYNNKNRMHLYLDENFDGDFDIINIGENEGMILLKVEDDKETKSKVSENSKKMKK